MPQEDVGFVGPLLTLRTQSGGSEVYVNGGSLARLGERLARRWPAAWRVFVVTDDDVARCHGERLAAALTTAGLQARQQIVPAGEATKSLAMAAILYDWLAGERAERDEPIVAFGGGVVGDLAGFVAATYLRGVPLAQAPTSLLAMVDSSVGGKTGVNLAAGKNLVGAFYQPPLVVVDPALLGTLPVRELRSGWAEVVKYALFEASVPGVTPLGLLTLLQQEGRALRELREPLLSRVIEHCIALKAAVVTLDEREGGLRRILNLGHTIGHAVEAAAGYGRYSHGEAVALGLRGVTRLAAAVGEYDAALIEEVDGVLDSFGLPTRIEGCAVSALLRQMGSDKKVKQGRVNWVLPRQRDEVEIRDDVPQEAVRAVLLSLGATPDGNLE